MDSHYFLLLCLSFLSGTSICYVECSSDSSGHGGGNNSVPKRYHVAGFDFEHVATPFIIALWILLASVAKIGFHLHHKLAAIFPESCMLILLGMIVGVALYFSNLMEHDIYYLDSKVFFLFLLPPIVFDAGYFMPNRAFFDNIGTILLYAIIGTVFNTICIGLSLWVVGGEVLGWTGDNVSLLNCLIFSSLISAVDPVAVLAVFEEIHVNEILFIIVFGESLLNDGVAVVLYHMTEAFSEIYQTGSLAVIDYFAGLLSFLVVALGGTAVGVCYGILVSFATRFTDHVRVIEPIFVFVFAYLAYLTAELFHLSGILSIVFCGIVMKHFVQANMCEKSVTTCKYFIKMLSNISETVIFMFLGLSTVTDQHDFHLPFVGFTLLFCLFYRTIGVIVFTWCANRFRTLKLTAVDQFVMAYGGLRGAIAFSLVVLIPEEIVPEKRMLVTTTICVIYFTVFVQGITIGPLVKVLRVKRSETHDITMNERIHGRLLDHCMAGMEDIAGNFGHHRLRDSFNKFNKNYLERFLLRERPKMPGEMGIYKTLSRLNLKDAESYIAQHGSFMLQDMAQPSSISQMIRRHNSTASMSGLAAPENGDPTHTDTVLDMQALEARYSRKMADASKIHHIVEDNMFQKRKKYSAHQRHRLDDVVNHPAFHHKLRYHLRRMVSKRQRELRAIPLSDKKSAPDAGAPEADGFTSEKRKVSFDVLTSPQAANGSDMALRIEGGRRTDDSSSDSDESDAGITFTAAPTANSGSPGAEVPPSPVKRTVAESSLPWKRAYIQPPMPAFNHGDETADGVHLAECPTWAANIDYSPDSPHSKQRLSQSFYETPEKSDQAKPEHEFSIPPPWRTEGETNKTNRNDSANQKTHVFDHLDDVNRQRIRLTRAPAPKTVEKPSSLPWHHDKPSLCESALPWRSPSVSNETEPMISPSASQVWTHQHAIPGRELTDGGQSHHSDPISGHHHVTASLNDSDLVDYHSLLSETFHQRAHIDELKPFLRDDGDDDEEAKMLAIEALRSHPPFLRGKASFLDRRPSVSLPIALNHEEDCRSRVSQWLQSSHPDSLACPPDFATDVVANPRRSKPNVFSQAHHVENETAV